MNRIMTVCAAAMFAFTPLGFAQEASELDVAEAEAFMGPWTVDLAGPQGPAVFDLELSDVGGKVAATVSNDQVGDATITDITKNGDDLVLSWQTNGPAGALPLSMTLSPSSDGVSAELDYGQGTAAGTATRP